MKRKILFVDDETNVLQGLKRMLRGMRNEWEMFFAGSGEEALQILKTDPLDVVVTDMRMPGMNGAQLLRKVIEKYPSIVRIVLSGHSDEEMILKSVRVAHQYLFKPCDAETLKDTVARACALQDLLMDDALKQVASQIGSLPSLPSLYQEIIAELESEDASINRVAQIISNDVAMTAKILQMVNSAFFALPRHIGGVGQAVNFLGLETIKTLVLSVQIFGQFRGKGVPESFLAKLWDHSMVTGAFSRAIAREENLEREAADDSFLAGILHDVGKLVLSSSFPEAYGNILVEATRKQAHLCEVEMEVLGTNHTKIGAYLMGLWGMGDPIIEALGFHHDPLECPARLMGPLSVVHVANALEHASGLNGPDLDTAELNREYLDQIGMIDKLPGWSQVCWRSNEQGDLDE